MLDLGIVSHVRCIYIESEIYLVRNGPTILLMPLMSSDSTNYQLPNGLIKVRRRWGQRHPQGANSGSNGKLKLMLNSKQLPPAHPYSMLANVYQASPF
jgi:hypothetical protein